MTNWLDARQVSKRYSISQKTLQRYVDSGKLPQHDIQRHRGGRFWKEGNLPSAPRADYRPSEKVTMARAAILRFVNGDLTEEEIGERRARLIRKLRIRPIRQRTIQEPTAAVHDRLFFTQDVFDEDEDEQ